MFINQWVQKVHTTAKTKGWWESPREEMEICQLFVTELAEASECARNGEPHVHIGRIGDPNLPPFYTDRATIEKHNGKEYLIDYAGCNGPTKPEGEAIELVDLLIRLGDYMGHKEWNLGEAIHAIDPVFTADPTFEEVVMKAKGMMAPDDFSERPLVNHFEIVSLIVTATESAEKTQPMKFAQVFLTTIGYMVHCGMDVEMALEVKAAYNEKRPYRHGGKLA